MRAGAWGRGGFRVVHSGWFASVVRRARRPRFHPGSSSQEECRVRERRVFATHPRQVSSILRDGSSDLLADGPASRASREPCPSAKASGGHKTRRRPSTDRLPIPPAGIHRVSPPPKLSRSRKRGRELRRFGTLRGVDRPIDRHRSRAPKPSTRRGRLAGPRVASIGEARRPAAGQGPRPGPTRGGAGAQDRI